MKRIHIAMAMLLLIVGARTALAAQPIYRNNVLTARHELVPGTHVRIVPPAGGVASSLFRGYEIVSRMITIRIEERLGVAFARTEETLTASALAAGGIKLNDSAKVTLNGSPALLLYCTVEGAEAEGYENTGLLIFAFGNDSLSSLIYGRYRPDDRGARELVQNAMLSAILETGSQAQETGGGYRVSTAGTSLKFVAEASMVRYFTVDGKPVPVDQLDDAMYTTMQRNQLVPDSDREDFANRLMEQYLSNHEHTIVSRQGVSYTGLQGIEIVAEFSGATRRRRTASGATRNVTMPGVGYQVVLFDPKGVAYVFNGIAVRDAQNYLAQFRKITGTFQLTK